jgi:Family of unknown function (DUF5719)
LPDPWGIIRVKKTVKKKILRLTAVLLTTALLLASSFLIMGPISWAAGIYNVTNINDSGPGSLRKAISDANANPGLDYIHFNITGSHTIRPFSALPTITDPVVIDGTTDSHFAGRPVVEINGQGAGDSNGLYIKAGGSTVKGLVVNRFQRAGIRLEGNGANTVRGNYLGTSVSGTTAYGNGDYGLALSSSSGNVIGQASASGRNLMSGNGVDGIFMSNSKSNVIMGNYIGTDVTGRSALKNGGHGILADYGSNRNTIGGTSAGARNIISGNADNGVYIRYSSSANKVQGNYIGTDVTGTADVGNGWSGVGMNVLCNSNVIGGTTPGARNVISGNGHAGVTIHLGSALNVVRGNYIGVDVHRSAMGNSQEGVVMNSMPGGSNAIGGKTAGAGNVIAHNYRSGVFIDGGSKDPILGNSIYENGRLGIDLYGDGVTNNDDQDPDGGPNGQQNYPLITRVNPTGVEGTLNSKPDTTFRVELFSNRIPDPSGYGEGQTYLGYVNVTTDSKGNARFSAPVTGTYVTATATDPDGNTSEFGTRSNIGSTSWVVPEGSTGGGFDTWILIQNPNPEEVDVQVTFATEEGPREPVAVKMAPESRTTLRVADFVPDNFNVSAIVQAGSPVVVERSMYWDKRFVGETGTPGTPQPYEMREGHANLAVPWEAVYRAPGSQDQKRAIYFPEGSTATGFDTWVLLTNPEAADATARVTLMTRRGVALEKDITVPAMSRKTIHVDELLPGEPEVATEVTSSTPLMGERSMYWDPNEAALAPYQMTGGHSTGGSNEASDSWYLAEGATAGGFDTYVLLMNPQEEKATVKATFTNAQGVAGKAEINMPPRSRGTLRLSDYVPDDFQVSTKLTSDRPIVAERSTYWDKRKAGEPCAMRGGTSSMGFSFTSANWVVPEGSTGGGFDSWVLISNTNDTSVGATVTFMTRQGPGTPFDISVKANSRYTLHVNDYVPDDFNVSTRITSKGGLVVERAMYWDKREAAGIQSYEMMGGHSAQGFTP